MTFARIFVMTIGGGMMWLGDQMYSKSIFFFGAALVALMALSFILSFGRTDTEPIASEPSKEIVPSDDLRIPLEFSKVEKIDGHTQQVTFKGKSFLIWKERGDRRTHIQEIGKGGHRVGSPARGSAKDAADYMKRKFKDI